MGKRLRVGLFGVALESVNFGVTALAFTQIRMLQRLQQEMNTDLELVIFSDDSSETVDRIKEIFHINHLEAKYIVRIKTGIAGLRRLKKDICACDFIIDLTYGDSFSDIYGLKNYYLYSVPKFIAIRNKKWLVLGPQTVGPFYNKLVEKTAIYIMKRAKYIVVRDEMSQKCAEKLTHRQDVLLTSDLAMSLPYEERINENLVSNKINIGLNVSQLLWEKDANNSNLEVSLSYRKLMLQLLDELQKRDIAVHLIVHVYTRSGYTEYSLAEELHKQYSNTILAPKFVDPMDAKAYIAKLDAFIGARMHATIGAFSSGVPVIPVAYSRKFEGLYGLLGYDYCVDLAKETEASALDKIMKHICNLPKLKYDVEKAFEHAEAMNEKYYNLLKELVEEV